MEIKFRAWDGHNKVMKYYTLEELAGQDKFNYDTEYEAIQSGFKNWKWLEYTGLEDKKGKEIYDGDVLVFQNLNGHPMEHESLEVIWHSYGWYVSQITSFVQPKSNIGSIVPIIEITPMHFTEVIGNIYENLELLKAIGQSRG